MIKTNPAVDFFFDKEKKWQDETRTLRTLMLGCGLTEELKWGVPCYTSEGTNIVLIHTFKEYCALLFFKGALMKDPQEILIQQTKNTQAARQIRFTGIADVDALAPVVKRYVDEAIKIEKAGLKVEFRKTEAFDVPEEFQQQLDEDGALKAAFEALTPGRQRAYLLHFSSAKQSATRASRVAKCTPKILAGKGLDDQ